MKEQEDKSTLHQEAQPKHLEKNSVQLIMAHDLAGFGTNETALAVGMTIGRVSIIKNSPLYREERARRFEALKQSVTEGTSKKILEDPARQVLLDNRVGAAEKLVALVRDGKNEFVQKSAAVDILEFSGISKPRQSDKHVGTTVVMEERLAQRFGFAKGYTEPTSEEVIERKVTITHNA